MAKSILCREDSAYKGSPIWSSSILGPAIFIAKEYKMIEVVCRSYPWTGEATITKRAIVAWVNVCPHRRAGGLNLLNLKIWNHTIIFKATIGH